MEKHILSILIFICITLTLNGQELSALHNIEKTSIENEYLIKTEISGLVGVDIARVIYKIDDKHTYKKSANNSFFSDRKNNEVKFYIMGVPTSGILNVEFNLTLNGNGDFIFPSEIQYSKNEEKKVYNLPQINITNELLAAKEKAEKEQQEKLLAEQKAKEDAAKQKQEEQKVVKTTNNNGKTYSVQILSLSNYSESRLAYYCKKHNISMNDIVKRNIDGYTKISIGKVNSKEEASVLQQKLNTQNGISQSFIVVIP